MQSWNLKSLVLCNEMNLNILAEHFGDTSKFKWEDPLILHESSLNGILKGGENKWVYIYHFGTLVFINLEYHEIMDVIKYVKSVDPALQNNNPNDYIDEYKIEIDEKYEYALYNDLMTSNEYFDYYIDILALVLAKSTALKKIETDTDKLLDNVEDIINYLDTGKFNMSDRQIAKTSAKVLRFKYNTISYLMLLDKPRSAWNNENIEAFYEQIISLFEFNERYKKITNKTEVLQDITDVFTSLTHEKRGTRLEIMVILLIAVELLISLFKFFQ